MIHWSKSLARRAKGSRANSFLIAAVTAVLVLLVMVLASCRGTVSSPLLEGKREESSIHGRVFHKSDNPSILQLLLPFVRSPFDHGLVVAIPSDSYASLADELDFIAEGLNLDSFVIAEKLLAAHGGTSTPVQRDGRYLLVVLPGDYVVCLANLGLPPPPEVFPTRVAGCVEVTVPEGEQVNQDLFFGIGGVTPD